jgi:zinc metalloprotease ZmpB
MSKHFLLIAFILCAVSLSAQKPPVIAPITIELPAEPIDLGRMQGNMRISDATGFPAAIYQENYVVSDMSDPEGAARAYLMNKRNLLGLTASDIQNNLRLHAIRYSATGTTVRLRQQYNNWPVNRNAEITIHINNHQVVDFVMNGFVYGVQLAQTTPAITAEQARSTVLGHLVPQSAAQFESNELMVLQSQRKNLLVYRVVMVLDQPLGEWECYVDAQTGALHQVKDISIYYHHHDDHDDHEVSVPLANNLWWLPPVNGSGTVFNPDPLTTAVVTYNTTGYTDGTDANTAQLGSQLQTVTLLDITQSGTTYSLVGPYAEIQDFEAPNKGLFTQTSSTFNFTRNADAFEAVNTYYHIDNVMRYINLTLGVTVMPYVYTTGVRFDPSGLNGADNSHYIGSTNVVSFGEGGVDDAEDADVIIHELGHGLHDWITVGGLSQVNGLSEGTGDYIAGSYSRHLGYWPTSNAAYNWVFNWDGHNPFWGGRILNTGGLYPGALVNQVHSDGQIWAAANMLIWNDIGRQAADKAFWLGLDVTNSSTNQNDAANAVYQASINLGYTQSQRLAIHTRYTARGYSLPAFPPFPIEMTKFEVRKMGLTAQLNWQTAIESQNDHFLIERSADGTQFEAIGQVKGGGTTLTPTDYTFSDERPHAGINYYRLRQVDYSGQFSHSPIKRVVFDGKSEVVLYPNPTTDVLKVVVPVEEGQWSLFDATGRLIRTQNFTNTTKSGGIDLQLSDLPTGNYWIQVVSEGQVFNSTFVKK